MTGERKIIRVGSRKSELALIQTRYVISLLSTRYPQYEFQIVTMSTLGDQILDKPLPKIGEKSLFTKELEVALAAECVDFVVHSLKDLPTCLPDGMTIGAVLKREDPRDALVLAPSLQGERLATLKSGCVIGTSSLRRTAQLSRLYPHLKIENIRGNLNTRLKKLDELDKYSAIMLAKAGLVRMGWDKRISEVLDCTEIMYAVGQGALAVECRDSDKFIIDILAPLHHSDTLLAVLAERSFLKTLGGGCSAPVAVSCTIDQSSPSKTKNRVLNLKGAVWSLDGKTMIEASDSCEINFKPNNSNIEDIEDVSNFKCCKQKVIHTDLAKGDCPNNPVESNKTEENPEKCKRVREVTGDFESTKCPYMTKKVKSDTVEDPNGNKNEYVQCPYTGSAISLPIGVDFMGKCPYLNSENVSKCPVNAEVFALAGECSSSSNTIHMQCPYLNKELKTCSFNTPTENVEKIPVTTKPGEETQPKPAACKSYCGLAQCSDISEEIHSKIEKLGVGLAEKLIGKGALDVMREAQAVVHSTTITL